MSANRCRLFGWSNETLHNGGNYILEVALHEYLLQVRVLQGGGSASSPDGGCTVVAVLPSRRNARGSSTGLWNSLHAERAPHIRLGGGRLLLCAGVHRLPHAPSLVGCMVLTACTLHPDPCGMSCCCCVAVTHTDGCHMARFHTEHLCCAAGWADHPWWHGPSCAHSNAEPAVTFLSVSSPARRRCSEK
jgi:hypothetical protein